MILRTCFHDMQQPTQTALPTMFSFEDSDDDGPSESNPLPRPVQLQIRRSGRGRKSNLLKAIPTNELAVALQPEETQAKPRPEPKSIKAVVPVADALHAFGPIASLPEVGSDLQKRFCQALSLALQDGIDYDDSVITSMFTHTHTSATSIAKFCNSTKERVKNAVIECGAAAVHGGAWLTGSLCCSIAKMIDDGAWRPVAMFRITRYDETPTKVRLPKEPSHLNNPPNQIVPEGTDMVEHAKVLQTEFQVGFLVHDETKGNYLLLRAFVPTPLQAVDRTTAENLRSCLEATMSRIPELRRVALKFPFRVHHACTDKYSSNMKTEKSIKSDQPEFVKHHVLCYVHRLATAITAANSLFPDETAGVLSVALACREVGSAGKLRDLLRQIFRDKLVIRWVEPKPEWTKHRMEVYDLYLPLTGDAKWANMRRRFVLNHLLNGNLQDSPIEHFCPFNHCQDEADVRDSFSRHVALALIPGKPPKYSRGRWTNYDRSVIWNGLLDAHHSLLQQIILTYTGAPQTQVLEPGKAIQDVPLPAEDSDDDQWCGLMQDLLREDGDRPKPNKSAPVCDDNSGGDHHNSQDEEDCHPPQNVGDQFSAFQWVEFNRRQKAQAGAFVSSNPGPSIAIMQQVCRHFLTVMHCFLKFSGEEWEREQEHLASEGKGHSFRALDCARGSAVQECFDALTQSLDSLPIALPSLSHTRHYRNGWFSMVSKGLCALHQLVRMDHRGFPFRLFTALDKDLSSINEAPPCMHDELTAAFVEHFLSKASHFVDCDATLEALGVITNVDVAKIECRHASNRDLTMLRGSGWTPSLSTISAKFARGTFKKHDPNQQVKVKKTVVKKSKCKRPGGAWRAFLSNRLASRTWNEDSRFGGLQLSMKDLSNEYKQLSAEEKAYFVEVGRLATLAGQHGHTPFGKRTRRPVLALPVGSVTNTGLLVMGNVGEDLSLVQWGDQPFSKTYSDFQKEVSAKRAASKPAPLPKDAVELPPSITTMIETSGSHAHCKAFVSPSTSFRRCGSEYKLHTAKWKPPVQEFAQARV